MEAGMVFQLFSERRHGNKINEIAREPSGSKIAISIYLRKPPAKKTIRQINKTRPIPLPP
jgi:hypothetical protein